MFESVLLPRVGLADSKPSKHETLKHVGSMLGQQRRWRANIKPAMVQCLARNRELSDAQTSTVKRLSIIQLEMKGELPTWYLIQDN